MVKLARRRTITGLKVVCASEGGCNAKQNLSDAQFNIKRNVFIKPFRSCGHKILVTYAHTDGITGRNYGIASLAKIFTKCSKYL